MYDVIVIGARVAGAPTAMLLAKKGYKVLLVDRDSFPSDTISTHILLPKGFSQLKKWGLAESVINSNAPIIHEVAFELGPITLSGTPPPYQGNSDIIAPRRYILDKILVDAAINAGVELMEKSKVEEILFENGVVSGIRYKTANGTERMEKARITIGADGKNSIVARTVKAEEYHVQPKLSCWYYAYWSGVPIDALTMYALPERAVGVIPTNDQMVCIPVSWPATSFQTFRSDIERNYMNSIAMSETLSFHMRDARRETQFTGMADLPGYFRKPFGPGWALVGDAAYHKDPITGQGMSDAMIYAEKLADAIDSGFKDEQCMQDALANYQHVRDEEVLPMYQFTCEWASHEPPSPEVENLLSSLQGKQKDINEYIGTIAGTFPIQDFYSPDNIQRLVSVPA